jgi:serine O-acetyltransferase
MSDECRCERGGLRDVGRKLDEDMVAYARQAAEFLPPRPGLLRRVSILLTPPLICSGLYRLSHWLWSRRHRRSARFAAWINFLVHKAWIAPASCIGGGLYIPHTAGIIFCGRAGAGLLLLVNAVVSEHSAAWGDDRALSECPQLGDDVSVGAGARVIGAITIGSRTRIGPGAVVTCRVPAGSIVVARGAVAVDRAGGCDG